MSSDKFVKRKRVVLSLKDKCDIIKRIKTGESAVALSKEYKVGKSTISGMKQDETKILQYYTENIPCHDKYGNMKKVLSNAESSELDSAIFRWFTQQRAIGSPISGPILCEKALQLNEKMGCNKNFKASNGWLQKFKARHGIRVLNIYDEKLSANEDSAKAFKKTLFDFVRNQTYSEDCIYNADETALYWRSLPWKSMVSSTENTTPAFKICKDRVTVMVCSNASGSHKLPLLIIGKSAKPRCFNHVSNVSINYKAQKNGFMNTELFKTWYLSEFIPNVQKYQRETGRKGKVLLLLDNAPSHSAIELNALRNEMFNVMFLPSNVTSLIQPMDQGVIEKLKRLYRKNLLRRMVLEDTGNLNVVQFAKNLTLKDCCYILNEAWSLLTAENLRKAWRKLFHSEEIEEEMIERNNDREEISDIHQIARCISSYADYEIENIAEWIRSDRNEQSHQILTDEEIIREVTGHNVPIDELEEEEGEEAEKAEFNTKSNDERTPTDMDALDALNTVIRWFQIQPESNTTHLEVLNRLKKLASLKISNKT